MTAVPRSLEYHTFVGGLVSDFHALEVPDNVSIDEINCDLDYKGSRRRRKGLMLEPSYTLTASTYDKVDLDVDYIKASDWNNVANDGSHNFLVVQVGATLLFYDKSVSPLSSGGKSFTVDLNDFAITGISDVSTYGVQMASGKGYLFVVGQKIEPFYISYDLSTDTITTTQLDLEIRDLTEQDTSLANDAQPTTLTDARKYDLLNQGWGYIPQYCYDLHTNSTLLNNKTVTALDWYFQNEAKYPPKSKPWWVGKRIGDKGHEFFVPDDTYDMVDGGTTLAALGHYITSPFNVDRNTLSGLTGLSSDVSNDRPTSVAFFSGRVFYGWRNKLLFSQILEDDVSVAAKCYMEADPTSQDVNDLVATDGGVVLIGDAGTSLKLFPMDNILVAFYNNGVWIVSGSSMQEGFSATGFSVTKVTNVGALSARSIVDVEGTPVWWAKQGIYTIIPMQAKFSYEAVNLIEHKLQIYYNNILPLAKEFASGVYDHIKKRIIWLFNNSGTITDASGKFYYDSILNYDITLKAFFPYSITPSSTNGFFELLDGVNIQTTTLASSVDTVVDANGVTVVDGSSNTVTINKRSFSNTETVDHDTKYLVAADLDGITGDTFPSDDSLTFVSQNLQADTNVNRNGSMNGMAYTLANGSYYVWVNAAFGTVPSGKAMAAVKISDGTVVSYSSTDFSADKATLSSNSLTTVAGFPVPNTPYYYFIVRDSSTNPSNFWVMVYTLDSDAITLTSTTSTSLKTNSDQNYLALSGTQLAVAEIDGKVYMAFNAGSGLSIGKFSYVINLGTAGTAPDGGLSGTWNALLDTTAMDTMGNYIFDINSRGGVYQNAITLIDSGNGTGVHALMYMGKEDVDWLNGTTGTGNRCPALVTLAALYPNGFTVDTYTGEVVLGSFDDVGLHRDGTTGASSTSEYTSPEWFRKNSRTIVVYSRNFSDTADWDTQGNYARFKFYEWTGSMTFLHSFDSPMFDDGGDLGITNTSSGNPRSIHFMVNPSDGSIHGLASYQGSPNTVGIGFLNFTGPDITIGSGTLSYGLSFADFTDTTFRDWSLPNDDGTIDIEGDEFVSHIRTFYMGDKSQYFQDDKFLGYIQTPYVYIYMENQGTKAASDDPDTSKALMRAGWDWANDSSSPKFSQQVNVYRYRPKNAVSVSRQKVRGRGRTLFLDFTSDTGFDFNILGWQVQLTKLDKS